MRHGRKLNHLSRTSSHRKALMMNMANSLILHKRISTTVAKAKALRKYIEPLLTKAKDDSTHARRVVFSYLGHKDAIKELFQVVSGKIAERPGGYTRILKTGNRLGDAAETCIIELVDFNETYVKKETKKESKKISKKDVVSLEDLSGVGDKTIESLREAGVKSIDDIIKIKEEGLVKIKGIGEKKAQKIFAEAKKLV